MRLVWALLCVCALLPCAAETSGEQPGDLPALLHADSGPTTESPDEPTVRFRWPLLAGGWWRTGGYFDNNPSMPGYFDFECSTETYNTHQGTDIRTLDYVTMREGVWILAAADGVVLGGYDGTPDRDVDPSPFRYNGVGIDHADGTQSKYGHTRQWSSLVWGGQKVYEGQPIALVGDNGASTWPHLHFQVETGGEAYDPFAGSCRSGDSLWKAQPPHIRNNAVEVAATGLTPHDAPELIHRPARQDHMHQNGDPVPFSFWAFLAYAQQGDESHLIWRKPDGTVWDEDTRVESDFGGFTDFWSSTELPGNGDQGTWTAEYRINGEIRAARSFVYDGVPLALPQGQPETSLVEHGVFRDSMQASDADGEIFRYEITTAASHGELAQYGPRGRHFSYVPESGFSGTDTFEFQVEDAEGSLSVPTTVTLDVEPTLSNALRLEGENDYLSVPDQGSLDLDTAFTLEAWIRRTTGSQGWQGIIDHRHPTELDLHGYVLYLTPLSHLQLRVGNGTTSVELTGTKVIPFHRWVHVAATWDGATLRLFLDGFEEPETISFAGPISYLGVGETRIGGSFEVGDGDMFGDNDVDLTFRGEIEEARIWDVARSARQIRNGATCAFFDNPLPGSVRARWDLDGDGSDESSYGNNASPANGASYLRTDSAFALDCAVRDLDGDGLPDGSDNCPMDANPAQGDGDGDGVGNTCDLCPLLSTRSQADSDRDGVGDQCDSCPFLGNTAQDDADTDGVGDLCDPAPDDPVHAVPTDSVTLSMVHDGGAGETTLSWNDEPFASSYEVYRGVLEHVRARFYGSCRNSADPDPTDTTHADPETPDPGQGFYYLVLGVTDDGVRGLAGPDSRDRQRDMRGRKCED